MNDLEFAALMCSRLCHDLISPVAALSNGLEVLEQDDDDDMQEHALRLIQESAAQASAKLQFARLAFGAATSQGKMIDLGEAQKVAHALFSHHKAELVWEVEGELLEKDAVRLLLNLLLIASEAAPRGGRVRVYGNPVEDGLGGGLGVEIRGEKVIFPEKVQTILTDAGEVDPESLDPRGVQPFLTNKLVSILKGQLAIDSQEGALTIEVKQAA